MRADTSGTGTGVPAEGDTRGRVLVPVLGADGPGIEVATALASQRDAELRLVKPVTYTQWTPLRVLPEPDLRRHREALGTVTADLRATADVPVEGTVRVGRDVPAVVTAAADEYDATAVVLDHPDRRRPGTSPLTVDRIAAGTDCDVVVVDGAPPVGEVSSVLLAVAGGPHTDLATAVASDVAAAEDAWVDVFHVVPTDADKRRRQRGRQVVSTVADRLADRDGVDEWLHEADDVVDALLEQSACYDVTVLGAPRKNHLQRFVAGSTVHDVRQDAPNAVITVRRATPRGRVPDGPGAGGNHTA